MKNSSHEKKLSSICKILKYVTILRLSNIYSRNADTYKKPGKNISYFKTFTKSRLAWF
jgi:hypothetical protein